MEAADTPVVSDKRLSFTAFCKNTGEGASGKKKLRDHEK